MTSIAGPLLDGVDDDVLHQTPFGIYVHVPFCLRRCGYCAFTTEAVPADSVRDATRAWTTAAVAELELAARRLGDRAPTVQTVYLGGGTPSLLHPDELATILSTVERNLDVVEGVEISIEANPDTIGSGTLAGFRDAGCTRVSFGYQSRSHRVLDLLDRTHDPERALASVGDARRAGFDQVSLDLISGTPGETAEDFESSVVAALGTGVDHLSVYSLSIEPGTRLAARVRHGELSEPDPDIAADRYEFLDVTCRAAGLEWYEVSNFASDDGARCRHNLLYWRNEHWWGVGPGAHSHIDGRRWSNHTATTTWSDDVLGGRLPVAEFERLDATARHVEQVMLGIRLREGLATTELDIDANATAAQLVDDGLLDRAAADGGRLVLTLRGRLLCDRVVRSLVGA